MTLARVRLPDALAKFGPLPPGIEADVRAGGAELPDSADQVEYVVLTLAVKPRNSTKNRHGPGAAPAGHPLWQAPRGCPQASRY
jgi:hypothetical protein